MPSVNTVQRDTTTTTGPRLPERLQALEARLRDHDDQHLTAEELERDAATLRGRPRPFRAPSPR
jgi:hypothetical protein